MRCAQKVIVTAVSMGVGAMFVLGIGLVFQGFSPDSLSVWATIVSTAIVNSAGAHLLRNEVPISGRNWAAAEAIGAAWCARTRAERAWRLLGGCTKRVCKMSLFRGCSPYAV